MIRKDLYPPGKLRERLFFDFPICNDRVILHNDLSWRVGWGTLTLPKYRSVFNSISGSLVFSSAKTNLLPLSTTKRSLDFESEIYKKSLVFLAEGLKIFSDYINRWEGQMDTTIEGVEHSWLVSPIEARRRKKDRFKAERDLPGLNVRGIKFIPELPAPTQSNR